MNTEVLNINLLTENFIQWKFHGTNKYNQFTDNKKGKYYYII